MISEKDKKIVKFLETLAETKRIDLSIVNNKRKIPLLYYEYDEKNVNFTLFDTEMRIFEFDLRMVHDCKFDSKSMEVWNQFIENI